jgi:hypothetical protein
MSRMLYRAVRIRDIDVTLEYAFPCYSGRRVRRMYRL